METRETEDVKTEKKSIISRLTNSYDLSDKTKYMIISLSLALIHTFFLILFIIGGVQPLVIYNVFVVAFYIFMGLVWARQEKLTYIFVALLIEVMFHAVFATLLSGWAPGFMIYTIVLIPVCFYMAYTLEGINKSLEIALFASIGISVIYIAVLVITRHVAPVRNMNSVIDEIFFYINNVIALIFSTVFSMLYIIEIKIKQSSLMGENVELEEQANYDKLTHLLNRNSMDKFLSDTIEYSERENKDFCILMADIDDFKQVNDTYGHDCGDEVLKKIAAIISNDVRQGDLVFRWGGEEMLVLIKADMKAAKNVAHRICNHVATSITRHKDIDIRVTITIGVAAYIKGMSAEELIKQADVKLYYGKNHGKDQVVA
ncbi:MAG: GGDEF domain-containing protein [Lachnospiraceae bacterium]|nr:GGDEF domain-containing protein [Lachnospiraceae bacterium]